MGSKSVVGAFSILVIAGTLLLSCSMNEQTNIPQLHVGGASGTINPGPEDFIAGHHKNRHFDGIHDSLYVKAVTLSDGKTTMAILTFDCIGLLYPALLDIRKAVAEEMPEGALDPAHIVMSSTHTHSGPDVVGLWGADQTSSGVRPEYMDQLVRVAADAIMEATQDMQPATVHYIEDSYGEEWVYNISKPEELDRSLTVLQFRGMGGESIATLTNFACHPTFLDAATDSVSSDYVGGFYSGLDKRLKGTNLFLQGAIGGWVQPEYEEKTFSNAMRRGEELAVQVINGLEGAAVMDSAALTFRSRVFAMPVSNPGFRQLAAIDVIKREITDSVQTEIALFSIGSAMFVTHPGETSPYYSLASKTLMNTDGPKFVLGLGMDALGYIVTPDFFDSTRNIPHSEYLTGMSVDGNAGNVVMEVIRELSVED